MNLPGLDVNMAAVPGRTEKCTYAGDHFDMGRNQPYAISGHPNRIISTVVGGWILTERKECAQL